MIVDNIHKKRFIRELLCKIGRHDYEAVSIERPIGGGGHYCRLECFYCEHQKKSFIREPTATPFTTTSFRKDGKL